MMKGGILVAGLGLAAVLACTCAQAQVARRSAWEPVSDRGGLTGPVGRWLDFYRAPYLRPAGPAGRAATGGEQAAGGGSGQGAAAPAGSRITLPRPVLPELQPAPQSGGARGMGAPAGGEAAPAGAAAPGAPGGAGPSPQGPGSAPSSMR